MFLLFFFFFFPPPPLPFLFSFFFGKRINSLLVFVLLLVRTEKILRCFKRI